MRRDFIVPGLALVVLNGLVCRAVPAQSSPDTVGARWDFDSQTGRYRVEVVATGVRVPFGMAALPNGRLLISDQSVPGRSTRVPAT